MMNADEQKIRERAYEIWVATGCENGLADLHWLSAEQAVMNEAALPAAKVAKKAAKPRAGRTTLPAGVAVRKRAKKETLGKA